MQPKLNALTKLKSALRLKTPAEVGEYLNAFKDDGDTPTDDTERYIDENIPASDGFDDMQKKKKKVK